MLFFGYIVSDTRCRELTEDIVKVVGSVGECKSNVPKLIVGLGNAKKYASDNGFEFDILEHTYPNGDMWTFKKTEKREFFEENLKQFKEMIIERQVDDVEYRYVNIYNTKFSKLKKLYSALMENSFNKRRNYIIIDGEMLYTAIDEKKVMGISMLHLSYIGIEREKIIEKLKKGKQNALYFTTSKNMWKMKDWFKRREYVIAAVFEKNAKNPNR